MIYPASTKASTVGKGKQIDSIIYVDNLSLLDVYYLHFCETSLHLKLICCCFFFGFPEPVSMTTLLSVASGCLLLLLLLVLLSVYAVRREKCCFASKYTDPTRQGQRTVFFYFVLLFFHISCLKLFTVWHVFILMFHSVVGRGDFRPADLERLVDIHTLLFSSCTHVCI